VSPTEGFGKVGYSYNLLKLVQIPLPTRVLRANRNRSKGTHKFTTSRCFRIPVLILYRNRNRNRNSKLRGNLPDRRLRLRLRFFATIGKISGRSLPAQIVFFPCCPSSFWADRIRTQLTSTSSAFDIIFKTCMMETSSGSRSFTAST
jgi:hypothetical protein